ncbi:MAG TPA: extracellular solute-binding protein, partial [Terracidiphilus sp.]|nr:extracellular solute-binding protein [Terracidiphilus sp.]
MTTLRIALRHYSDFENALQEQARLFAASRPGITVQLVSLGIHELYQTALTDGGLREGRYDLALLVTDWLAEGITSRSLEDLQMWQDRLPIPDWPQGWPRSLVRPLIFDGKLSSLPWHDGPECLVYRSDIFVDPKRREDFLAQFGRALEPPVTWQEFAETAQF